MTLTTHSHSSNYLRILHSADWHIGTLLQSNPQLARERKATLLSIIEQMLDFAKENEVDICLFSGDLFDESFPQDEEKNYIFSLFEKTRLPIVITNGNHDPLSFQFKQNLNCPHNVYIFNYNTEKKGLYFENLRLLVGGASFQSPTVDQSLIPQIKEDLNQFNKDYLWKVLCLHGQVVPANSFSKSNSYNPIYLEDLENEDFDFVALGHVHKKQEFLQGKTLISYSGALLGRGFDELGALGFSVIDLKKDEQNFKSFNSNSFIPENEFLWQEGNARQIRFVSHAPQFLSLEITLNPTQTLEDLKNIFREIDPTHYYSLHFKGSVNKDLAYHLSLLPERLKLKLKHFKFKNSSSLHFPLEPEKLSYLEKVFYEHLQQEQLPPHLTKTDLFNLFQEAFHTSEKDSLSKQFNQSIQELEAELSWIDEI